MGREEQSWVDALKWGPAISLGPLPTALQVYHSCIETRPLLLPSQWLRRIDQIHRLLLVALQNLLVREETADFLEIEGKARDQIRWANQQPLQLGCLRPDFILDADGRPFICEINARFAVNGFLCSAYLSDQFASALPHYVPTCWGPEIRSQLALPPGSCIVKQSEPGWDIHQLSQECRAPILDHLPAQASCLVLELHQEELLRLPSMPQQPYWNDLRCQWLGHDKRLLHWLGEPDRLRPWLGDEAETLSAAIAPTWRVSEARQADRASVLKPNRSGKGEGMVFGLDLDGPSWLARLAAAPPEWVVQSHIESLALGEERLVGTLLSRDQHRLGVGILRASRQRLVNVSGGGRVIFPMTDGS